MTEEQVEIQTSSPDGEQKPTGGMAIWVKWLIGLVVLGVVGYGGYYAGQMQS